MGGSTKPEDFLKSVFEKRERTSQPPNFQKRKRYGDLLADEKRRRPRFPGPEKKDEFVQLTPGDPEGVLRDYRPSAQVESATAEKAAYEARKKARTTLEDYGSALPDDARAQLAYIAEHGHAREGGFDWSPFLKILDVLDTPGELIRAGIADVSGLDEKAGGELTLGDYWDLLTSNEEGIGRRHGQQFAQALGADSDFAFEGQHLLKQSGVLEQEARTVGQKVAHATSGFLFDVLTDPLTYVSFGTAGVGRKAAVEAITATAVNGGRKAVKAGKVAGWKGAAQHLLAGGKAADLDGVARRAADLMEDRVAREIDSVASAMARQLDEAAEVTGRHAARAGRHEAGAFAREADQIREVARNRILAEELRVVELVEGVKLSKLDEVIEAFGKIDDINKIPTAFEREVSEMASLIADKKFRTLNKKFGPYVAEAPVWATGGLGFSTSPFSRRNMPMVRIPGTRFDGPGQAVLNKMMDVLPESTASWLRRGANAFSTNRQYINRAKAYSREQGTAAARAWFVADAVGPSHALIGEVGVKLHALVGEVRDVIQDVHVFAKGAGMSDAEADDILRRLLDGTGDTTGVADFLLRGEFDKAQHVLRATFDTVHDAAVEAGMRLRKQADYVPLVMSEPLSRVIGTLARDGRAILFDVADDPELRLGLELLSEFVGTVKGGGRAVKALGDSPFTRARTATSSLESKIPGVSLLDVDEIREVLEAAKIRPYEHDKLNVAIAKALEHLVGQGRLDSKLAKAVGETAYETELSVILEKYLSSMSTAIQLRDSASLYRRAGLLVDKAERISASRTLMNVQNALNSDAHPIMRFLDDVADAADERAASVIEARASKMTTVTIAKGWSMDVPAAVVGTDKFETIQRGLRRVYERVGRNLRSAEDAAHRHYDRLVADGVPEEVAHRVSLMEADTEFAAFMADLRRLGDEQAADLRVLATEQAARNAHKTDPKVLAAQLRRAAEEAQEIQRGVLETIRTQEDQLARKLKFPVGSEPQQVFTDLTRAGAPDGSGRSFMQWLGDQGDSMVARDSHTVWKPLEDLEGDELAEALAHPELAARGYEDLLDRLHSVELTVKDLADFSDPSRAARTLEVLAARLDEVGQPWDDLLPPEVREAVHMLDDAENLLADVRAGRFFDEVDEAGKYIGPTVEETKELLIEVKANLVQVAEQLATSDVAIADALTRLGRDGVVDLTEDTLFSHPFLDVWAAAMHNLRWMNRTEMASAMREQGVKSVSQKALFRNNSKELMRETAASAMYLWHEAVAETRALRGLSPLAYYEPSYVELAIRALRSGDMAALSSIGRSDQGLKGLEEVLNAFMREGLPTLDGWLSVRPSGAIVFEHAVESPVWATLDEVLPTMRALFPDGDAIPIEELLDITLRAFREHPDDFLEEAPQLARFLGALDELGGLPVDMEDFEYLRNFAADLKVTEAGLTAEAGRVAQKVVLTNEELDLARHGLAKFASQSKNIGRNMKRLADGEVIPVVEEAAEAKAVAKWFQSQARPTSGLHRGMRLDFMPEPGLPLPVPMGNSTLDLQEAARFAQGSTDKWVVVFPPNTPAAVNQMNTNVPLVSGMFRIGSVDEVSRVVHLTDEVAPILPQVRPPTAAKRSALFNGAVALDEVLDAVDKAARKGGMGEVGLRKVWEKNVALLLKGLPSDVVDRARELVDYTVAVRKVHIPKRVLDAQHNLRGTLWRPLEEAWDASSDAIADLASELRAAGADNVTEAIDDILLFREELARLYQHGDSATPSPRLVASDDEFVLQLELTRKAGKRAVAATEWLSKNDPKFLDGITPPSGSGSIRKWAKQTYDHINKTFQPEVVPVSIDEGFVDVTLGGVVGEVFEDSLANHHVARILENMAGHLAAVNTPEGVRAVAENVRAVEKWWRASATVARPTFVPRNVLGGVFNNLVIGVGVAHYAFTAKEIMPVLSRVRRGVSTWELEIKYASPKIRAYLEGLSGSHVLEEGFARSSLAHLRPKTKLKRLVNPLSYENAIFRTGGRIMESSEDFLRASAFVANFDPLRPATARQARALAMAAHFDYKNLTPLEKNIKRVMPFFTWTKNNIPLQLRMMFERPAIITKYRHLTSNIDAAFSDDDGTFSGNRWRSALNADLGFSLGEGSAFWANAVFDPDLPFKDIEDLLRDVTRDGLFFGSVNAAINMITPVYSAPFEGLEDPGYDVVAPVALTPLFKLFGAETNAFDDTVLADPRAVNLITSFLPQLGEYSDFLGQVPSNPNQAARLGYDTSQPIDLADRLEAIALRAARVPGLQLDIPADSYFASNQARYDVIPEIMDAAARSGRIIDPEDLDILIDDILSRAGVPAAAR